jgi:MFS family permease
MTSTTHQPALARTGWLSAARRPLTTMIATNFLSLFSNQLTAIAVPWFVLTLTGSATQTGLTAAATILPSVIMSFFGGALVDRMSARKMSIFSDAVSGVTVAFVPMLYALDLLSFPLLLLLMFLGAVFDSPGSTARSTMLPRLSERAGIPIERVNSIYGVNQSLTGLFGAAIAGLLVGSFGAVNVLWLNAIAFVISALGMMLFVPELGVHPPSGGSMMDDLREGIGWLWNKRALRTTILAAVVVNGIFSPLAAVVLPYFAKTEFGSATSLGLIMSGFGAGGLIGALSYGAFGTRISRRLQLTISLFLITLPVMGMVALPNLWVTWLLQFVIGMGVGAANPMGMTFLLTMTPPNMLGRVSGVSLAGAMVAAPVGVLIAGPLIAVAGLRGTFLIYGAILIAVLIGVLTKGSLHELDEAPPVAET